jgi:hypothetical protein
LISVAVIVLLLSGRPAAYDSSAIRASAAAWAMRLIGAGRCLSPRTVRRLRGADVARTGHFARDRNG